MKTLWTAVLALSICVYFLQGCSPVPPATSSLPAPTPVPAKTSPSTIPTSAPVAVTPMPPMPSTPTPAPTHSTPRSVQTSSQSPSIQTEGLSPRQLVTNISNTIRSCQTKEQVNDVEAQVIDLKNGFGQIVQSSVSGNIKRARVASIMSEAMDQLIAACRQLKFQTSASVNMSEQCLQAAAMIAESAERQIEESNNPELARQRQEETTRRIRGYIEQDSYLKKNR